LNRYYVFDLPHGVLSSLLLVAVLCIIAFLAFVIYLNRTYGRGAAAAAPGRRPKEPSLWPSEITAAYPRSYNLASPLLGRSTVRKVICASALVWDSCCGACEAAVGCDAGAGLAGQSS